MRRHEIRGRFLSFADQLNHSASDSFHLSRFQKSVQKQVLPWLEPNRRLNFWKAKKDSGMGQDVEGMGCGERVICLCLTVCFGVAVFSTVTFKPSLSLCLVSFSRLRSSNMVKKRKKTRLIRCRRLFHGQLSPY